MCVQNIQQNSVHIWQLCASRYTFSQRRQYVRHNKVQYGAPAINFLPFSIKNIYPNLSQILTKCCLSLPHDHTQDAIKFIVGSKKFKNVTLSLSPLMWLFLLYEFYFSLHRTWINVVGFSFSKQSRTTTFIKQVLFIQHLTLRKNCLIRTSCLIRFYWQVLLQQTVKNCHQTSDRDSYINDIQCFQSSGHLKAAKTAGQKQKKEVSEMSLELAENNELMWTVRIWLRKKKGFGGLLNSQTWTSRIKFSDIKCIIPYSSLHFVDAF